MASSPTITVAGHDFPADKPCIVCDHVLEGAEVLTFAHDADGDLQFACGAEAHGAQDWHLVCLEHIDPEDFDMGDLPSVAPGFAALRESADEDWVVVDCE